MPAQENPVRLGYVPAIDGLRCLAILAVFVFHLRPLRLPGGFAGVDLFFVISGFVVTASVARREFGSFGELLRYFYARRFVRILPALLVVLIAVAFLSTLFIPLVGEVTNTKAVGLAAFFGASNLVLALSPYPYFAGSSGLNPLIHTWTLGVEEQYYLLFPLLYWLSRPGLASRAGRPRLLPVAAASLLSLGLFALWPRGGAIDPFYMMPMRFWELGAGMLLFLTIERWSPRLSTAPRTAAWSGFAACGGSLAWLFWRGAPELPLLASIALAVAASAGLIALACARPEAPATRMLASRPLVFVGRISYSLYLWHWPVFVLFKWTVGLETKATALAAAAVALAAATASYYLVENPIRRSRRVGALPRGAVIAAAGAAALASGAAALLVFRSEPALSLSRYAATGAAREEVAQGPCRPGETLRTVEWGEVRTFVPSCRSAVRAPRLFVIGDSHARYYEPMLRRYAADTGAPAALYSHLGCEFPALRAPQSQQPRCARFFSRALDEIGARMAPGDVVYMVSMHLVALDDFWVAHQGTRGLAASAMPRASGAAKTEALALLAPLAAAGARLVFEAPKPIFRSSPFACMDAFNRRNPVCRGGFTIDRGFLLQLRRPVVEDLDDLSSALPGSTLWDPFPLLCPGRQCDAFADGRPLYWDSHHINRFGAERLYPPFRSFILAGGRALGRPAAPPPAK